MGAPTLQGTPTYDFAKFSQKLHGIETIWTWGVPHANGKYIILLEFPKYHRKSKTFWSCYILIRSFSTPHSDSKIDTFALLRASQMRHLIPSIPKIPNTHEQSFIRIAPSPQDSTRSASLITLMLEIGL